MSNIVAFSSRPRLAAGDVAEIVKAKFAENLGKTVTVVRLESGDDLQGEWFEVRAKDCEFVTYAIDTGAKDKRPRKRMVMPADSLRRVWGAGARVQP